MPYRYLEEITTADAAFEAQGQSLEELFTSAGNATAGVMVEDPEGLEDRTSRQLDLEDDDLELLLYRFLQEIVYYKDAEQLLMRPRQIEVRQQQGRWTLHGRLAGDEIGSARHEPLLDVKAVTLHKFEVKRTERGWTATVVLDV